MTSEKSYAHDRMNLVIFTQLYFLYGFLSLLRKTFICWKQRVESEWK